MVDISEAIREIFEELLTLNPRELTRILKDNSSGPCSDLYKALYEYDFINECNGCKFHTNGCSLPSLTPCPYLNEEEIT